jgi:Xaa-Pro aminopeptidase
MSVRTLVIGLLLAGAAGSVSAQEGEFAARRSAVFEAIGDKAVALIQGAPSPKAYVRFRQSNDFYYLCGVESPHAYLLLDGSRRRATVYLPRRNEARERMDGKTLSAEDAEAVRKLSGVEAVESLEALGHDLARFARSSSVRTVFVPFSPAEGLSATRDIAHRALGDILADPWDGHLARESHFIQLLRTRLPELEVRDLSPALDRMRLIKSRHEIELIRRATQLSGMALIEGMRSTRPGMMEYEIEAIARFVFTRHGAQGEAYHSLVASGPNAWFPHYHASKRRMEDGELLLVDVAPDYGYYVSDVTRMWPVNGRFSREQKELYNFYLACYRAILGEIRPGLTAAAIMQSAAGKMETILSAARFTRPHHAKAAQEFVQSYRRSAASPTASLGHWVGMAAHDVGSSTGPLRPGMVFTIEPQLRVPEEQVYIRLEDLIIVTETGIEIASSFVPLDPDEIEKVMAEEGMLERKPRH